MCGRFAFYSPSEATAALFGASGSLELKPRYNIAPTQDVAAIRTDEVGSRELTSLRWGLVPFWAKDASIGNRMINARAETVAEKPAFRAAYRRRRCLVLADGFYEWHKEGAGKTPYFISLASEAPFAFAGLWENWKGKESDESIQSATLITAAADDFMSSLHHRMPVILERETADRWLAGDDDLIAYAISHPPKLRAWPVDRRVNNARNEGVNLIDVAGEVLES
jgi:putative SOS response-associated peptidase YedK